MSNEPISSPAFPNIEHSTELYQRAGELIPGWTQLISRRADQFANGVSPVYAQRAKGARFVDVDENEFIDWVNAVGAVILGHADDVVNKAVKEQIDRGSIYTLNSPLEIELAEELIDIIPSAEMVRYTKGGGEACAVAARIARGATGRDLILICGYHGWHDWYQAANYGVDPESGEYPFAGIEPIGVPRTLAGSVVPFTYGDVTGLSQLLDDYKGQVAAVMMEPARSELPPAGYLEEVRRLTKAHDVVLIFDEVSCGWRPALGGMQEVTGVTPDMTVVAKAMSNGYPMGAVVGKREVMEAASIMFISSSYWSDNVGLIASLTTLRELKRRNSTAYFNELGEALRKAINTAIQDAGLQGSLSGIAANPYFSLTLPAEVDRRKVNTLLIQEMARHGVHTGIALKPTLAHGEAEIATTQAAMTAACHVIRRALDEGAIDKYLVVDVKKEPFRRLVR